MVANCVANGCHNLHDSRNKLSFHTFPFKRPEILELWVKAIDRTNWHPSKASRLCGQHFTEEDYQQNPGTTLKLLKWNAVPSIFGVSKYHIKSTCTTKVLKRSYSTDSKDSIKIEENDFVNSDEVQVDDSQIINSADNKTRHVATQTELDEDSYCFYLQRKIKTLQQKVRRRDVTISNLSDLIKQIKDGGYTPDNVNTVLTNYFEADT